MTELRVADEPVETLTGGHVERADGASGGVHATVGVVRSPTGSGRRLGSRRARPATTDMRQRLQQVLAGPSFPADRWELIVTADMYGADLVTRNELHALVPFRFASLARGPAGRRAHPPRLQVARAVVGEGGSVVAQPVEGWQGVVVSPHI